MKTCFMASHSNRRAETVLMMGHNIYFKGVIGKIIPKLSRLPLLIWSTAYILIEYVLRLYGDQPTADGKLGYRVHCASITT